MLRSGASADRRKFFFSMKETACPHPPGRDGTPRLEARPPCAEGREAVKKNSFQRRQDAHGGSRDFQPPATEPFLPRPQRGGTLKNSKSVRWLTSANASAMWRAMKLTLTAIFQKVRGGYVAFVEELPGANTQGKTLAEARANLAEAVQMVLEANRELAEETVAGHEVIREPFLLTVA